VPLEFSKLSFKKLCHEILRKSQPEHIKTDKPFRWREDAILALQTEAESIVTELMLSGQAAVVQRNGEQLMVQDLRHAIANNEKLSALTMLSAVDDEETPNQNSQEASQAATQQANGK
jgi:histone H3/H4